MTIATPHIPTTIDDDDQGSDRVRARRRHSLLNRHVPSCRIRGMGF